MEKEDIKQIREEFSQVIRKEVNPQFKQIREEFSQVIRKEVNPQFKQIREEFSQVIEDNINPQFEEIRGRLGGVENKLGSVENRLGGVENRLGSVEKDLKQVKAEMVTKSYLDDKLADLEGGLVAKLRKEDTRVNRLIEIMKKKSLLSKSEVEELNEFKIFPRVSHPQN